MGYEEMPRRTTKTNCVNFLIQNKTSRGDAEMLQQHKHLLFCVLQIVERVGLRMPFASPHLCADPRQAANRSPPALQSGSCISSCSPQSQSNPRPDFEVDSHYHRAYEAEKAADLQTEITAVDRARRGRNAMQAKEVTGVRVAARYQPTSSHMAPWNQKV